MQNNIKILLLDFSYTLIFPKSNESINSLNGHYQEVKRKNNKANPLETLILNQELLDYLRNLKTKYKIYIFTSGFIHTDPIIAQYLKPVFDGYITSKEISLPKSFPDAYKIISNMLGVNIDQILFIDDQQKNVQAANIAGVKAIRFTNNQNIFSDINNIID